MDKVKLYRVFRAYIEGQKVGGRLRPRDMAVQFGLPVIAGAASCFLFLMIPESVFEISGIVSNAISAVSIMSGLMCALAVLVFQLRLQLSMDDKIKVDNCEYKLIDYLFNDSLWDVVVGLTCALVLVLSSGLINAGPVISSLFAAISAFLLAHFMLVTAMCVKRLSIAYEVMAKAWSSRS